MNLLDICFIAIIVFGAYRGYKIGFIAAVSSIVGALISLIGAYWLYKPTALLLDDQFALSEKISPWISNKLAVSGELLNNKLHTSISDASGALISRLEMPDFIKELLNHFLETSAVPVSSGTSLGESIEIALTSLFLSVISFLLLYIALKLLFKKVMPKFFTSFLPKPIKTIDKLAGFTLGGGAGLLSIVVLIVLLTPIASMSALQGEAGLLLGQMNTSTVVDLVTKQIIPLR